MEMNPLLLFENNCFGKCGVLKCLSFAKNYFKHDIIACDINNEKFDLNKSFDLWYGVIDIKNIDKILPESSIDFILTDPPYGGLVQYLDLSTVWLSWLKLYDPKYTPDYENEITVNKKSSLDDFKNNFLLALKNLHKVLKNEGRLVLTFNNKDIRIWGAFLSAIAESGFEIEKVIHQHNKRSGESNVSDPNGTSASDYYIRCKKSEGRVLKSLAKEEIEKLLLEKAKELILERNEPTPYEILFNGLLVKVSQSGLDLTNFDDELTKFFNKHNGNELIKTKNIDNRAGDYWWIKGKKYLKNSSKCLSNKVRKTLESYFANSAEIKDAKLFEMIFKKFPNGMTPDVDTLSVIINEFAYKKGDLYIRR